MIKTQELDLASAQKCQINVNALNISAMSGCNHQKCTCHPNNTRRRLWIFFEDPYSSVLSRVSAIILQNLQWRIVCLYHLFLDHFIGRFCQPGSGTLFLYKVFLKEKVPGNIKNKVGITGILVLNPGQQNLPQVYHHSTTLFPPTSAVNGIKSAPPQCVSICQCSHG